MLKVLATLLLLLLVTPLARANPLLTNVVFGGVRAANNSFILQSTVKVLTLDSSKRKISVCTGMVISRRTVLTAASCLNQSGKFTVAVDFYGDLTQPAIEIGATAVRWGIDTRSDEFKKRQIPQYLDYALITLAVDRPWFAKAILISPGGFLPAEHDRIGLAGYGVEYPSDDDGLYPTTLGSALKLADERLSREVLTNTRVYSVENNITGLLSTMDSGGPAYYVSNHHVYVFGMTIANRAQSDNVIYTLISSHQNFWPTVQKWLAEMGETAG